MDHRLSRLTKRCLLFQPGDVGLYDCYVVQYDSGHLVYYARKWSVAWTNWKITTQVHGIDHELVWEDYQESWAQTIYLSQLARFRVHRSMVDMRSPRAWRRYLPEKMPFRGLCMVRKRERYRVRTFVFSMFWLGEHGSQRIGEVQSLGRYPINRFCRMHMQVTPDA